MAGARAQTPDAEEGTEQPPDSNLPDEAPDVPLLPISDTGRIKSVAGVPDVDPVHILKKVTGRLSSATEAFVADVASHYRVAQGSQAPGEVSNEYRVGMKRGASTISRSQYEIYSFSSTYDVPEAAVHELLKV